MVGQAILPAAGFQPAGHAGKRVRSLNRLPHAAPAERSAAEPRQTPAALRNQPFEIEPVFVTAVVMESDGNQFPPLRSHLIQVGRDLFRSKVAHDSCLVLPFLHGHDDSSPRSTKSFVQLQRIWYRVTPNDRQFDATEGIDRIHTQRIPQFRGIEIDNISGDLDLPCQDSPGRFPHWFLRGAALLHLLIIPRSSDQ